MVADLQQGRITQRQYLQQVDQHATEISQLTGNYREAQRQVVLYGAALRRAGRSASMAFDVKPIAAAGKAVGGVNFRTINLGHQLNDIGQQVALGVSPFTIIAQQGSQILGIYAGQGGVNAALRDMGTILGGVAKRAGPLLVVVGALAGALKLLQRELNIEIEGNREFEELRNEVAELDDKARASIQTFVTFGDVIKATFQVAGERIMSGPIGTALRWLGDQFTAAADTLTEVIPPALDVVVNVVRIGVLSISARVKAIPIIFKKGFLNAKANVLFELSAIVGAVGRAVEGIAKSLNQTLGTDIKFGQGIFDVASDLDELSLKATEASSNVKSLSELWKEFTERATEISEETPVSDFFADVKDQATQNALERIRKGIEEAGEEAKKSGKKIKTLAEKLKEELVDAADGLAGVFGSAFERLAETGRLTFRDFVKDMNRLIIRSTSQVLQKELSNMFENLALQQGGLGSPRANVFSALFGGGGLGLQTFTRSPSGGGNIFGSIIKGIGSLFGRRARGGIEMPFRNFIAGEEGSEIISQDGPSGARRVMTAGQTRARMGMMMQDQRPIQVIQNIQTPDVQSFRQSQPQLAARASMFIARGRRNQ